MLSYHKALDSNHAVFRMLCLLAFLDGKEMEIERIRILDFYSIFPYLIAQISVPMSLVGKKNQFKASANQYNYAGDPRFLFAQIKVFQETALSLLAAKRIIDPEVFENGLVKKGDGSVSSELEEAAISVTTEQGALFEFLVKDLEPVPLLGDTGLKKRTGLMEYRYDDV